MAVGTTTVTTTTAVTITKTSSAISQPLSSPIVQSLSHISTDFLSTSQSEVVIKGDVINEERAKNNYYDERDSSVFCLVRK